MSTIQIATDTQTALTTAIGAAAPGDTLVFSSGGTITLTHSLTIAQGVTIDGGGTITLLGNGGFTDVVMTGGTVTLRNLTIAGGTGVGADGTAGSAGSVNGGNGADAAGGIFELAGRLTVSNVTFLNDSAAGGNGGAGYSFLDTSGKGGGGGGGGGSAAGAIFNEGGTLVTANLVFSNVTATAGAGGDGGYGGGALTAEGVPTPSFGGTGGIGGGPGMDAVDGQSGNGPGGGLGAFGGLGGLAVTAGSLWLPAAGGGAGNAGTGLNALGGGGGGGGAGGIAFDAIGGLGQVVPCFAAGTRIDTPRGSVPVERLRVGDEVRLAHGGAARVRWLGRRTLRTAGHARPADVMPVRIAAGAFGPGIPRRAVMLSPDHAVYVGGVLIPVRYLLNGATIAQCRVRWVTYHHVELDRHDVLLAEGLPAESYLDTGNRGAFADGREAGSAYAQAVWRRAACAPLRMAGAEVLAAQARLLARAAAMGFVRTDDPAPALWADGGVTEGVRIGRLWRFRLPAPARRLRLRSRRAVPAEMRPGDPDGRRLGVAVDLLRADGKRIDLAQAREGWHALEGELRWTDGDARLPVAGVSAIEINLPALVEYWASQEGVKAFFL